MSFGIVSFPVQAYVTSRPKDLRFNNSHRECGNKLNSQSICRHCNIVIEDAKTETVKAFEISKGRLVTLEDDVFTQLPLRSTKDLEITQFVPAGQVDPSMLERTFLVTPDSRVSTGSKAFTMFRTALAKAGVAAVAKCSIFSKKEKMVLIEADGKMLRVSVLHWPDEMTDREEIEKRVDDVPVSEAEMDMAMTLLGTMRADVDTVFAAKDEYREALVAAIEARASGAVIPMPATEPAVKADDLMAALQASLDAAKKAA